MESSIRFTRGHFVDILVQVFSFPYTWTIEDRLTFDDRFEKVMDKDGIWEVHTLTIKDAVMEDAGTYEVVASNRLGENAATGTLAIVTEPPTFPVELQVIYCKYSIFHFSEV